MIPMHHGRIQSPSAAELAQLAPDGRPNYNRLIFESSPYLLQHATNPVDWYPWGEAAFARAREEQKPIFLSIGYATCHWCHVMEHESFENPEAAARLNEVFVCVKVDKEERPDIDNIYMQAVLATSGHGGWPMTVLLTHEATPFFAGTYLPLRSRGGRMGLLELIHRVSDVWRTKRAELEADAAQIAEHVRRQTRREPGTELDEAVLETGYTQLAQRFDRVEGGFGRAPKFPTPHHLLFLLRYHRHHPQSQALSMVTQTLVQMRRGGIFDQVGFGFHRYSTDGVWLLPHFEKMLYDQALLVMAYTEAYQVTRDPQFARTVHEVCTYVLRDLRDADGGFFSAEDADSEGVEGKFYVWSQGELVTLLGPEDAALYAQVYHFEPGGNFSEEATGHRTGDNIPHLRESYEDLAKRLGFAVTALTDRLEQARARLFSFRETRVRPLKDDKVLTDWNGLMIAALAKAGRALACPAYHEAACQAASFIAEHLRDARGFLMKRYRNGQSGLPAHLDDYAFFVWGLIELHQSDYQDRWLDLAVQLTDQTLARFRDSETGAFRFSAHDGETLMVHTVESYDGALPSGNSVLVSNLLRLGRLTGQTHYEEVAQAILDAFSRRLAGSPANSTFMLCGLDLSLDAGADVVVVGRPGAADTEEMLAALQQTFLPSVCVHFKSSESATAGLDRWAPYTQSMETLAGSSTAYVCRDFHCSSPTASCSEMLHQLQGEGCED